MRLANPDVYFTGVSESAGTNAENEAVATAKTFFRRVDHLFYPCRPPSTSAGFFAKLFSGDFGRNLAMFRLFLESDLRHTARWLTSSGII